MGESVDTASQPESDDTQMGIEDIVVQDQAETVAAADDTDSAPDPSPEPGPDVAPVEAPADELDALAAALEAEQSAPAQAESPEPVSAEPESSEQEPESLDDIAPAPSPEPPAPLASGAVSAPVVPWWPFLTYLGAWVALAGIAVWQLLELPEAQVAYESAAYGVMILGGVVMTAVGPLLILAVWLATRSSRSAGARSGLLTSALLKGALATLSGAIIWWGALVIVDYLRLGTPL